MGIGGSLGEAAEEIRRWVAETIRGDNSVLSVRDLRVQSQSLAVVCALLRCCVCELSRRCSCVLFVVGWCKFSRGVAGDLEK